MKQPPRDTDAAVPPADTNPGLADVFVRDGRPAPDHAADPPPMPGPDVATPPDRPSERTLPVPPDGPPVLPDGPWVTFPDAPPRSPDGRPPVVPDGLPPLLPDGRPPVLPDVAPRSPDGRPPVVPDGLPPLLPDVLPPIIPDAFPPVIPDASPDGRRSRPDTAPPVAECVVGAACTVGCVATCASVGLMTCECTGGTLTCGSCQLGPITISPDPCPESATGKECPLDGQACVAFTAGRVSGACMCQTASDGSSLRWTCIPR